MNGSLPNDQRYIVIALRERFLETFVPCCYLELMSHGEHFSRRALSQMGSSASELHLEDDSRRNLLIWGRVRIAQGRAPRQLG